MNQKMTDSVLIISIITVFIFAGIYLILFKMIYNAKKKIISNHIDDDVILKNMQNDYKKYLKSDQKDSFENYLKHHKQKEKHVNYLTMGIAGMFYLFFIGILAFSLYIKNQNGVLMVNDKSLLVIETGSMSQKHRNNKYLIEENLNNQFERLSLIEIKKPKQIKLYDVCAFHADDRIIVHRVIKIKEVDGKKLYTFRGDANGASLEFEVDVPEEKIVGVYTNKNNLLVGHLVFFLQSGIGVITILASILVLLFYNVSYDKINKIIDKRYYELLEEKKYLEF